MSDLKTFLFQVDELMTNVRKSGWLYHSYEGFIMWEGTPRIDVRVDVSGRVKECYKNAYMAAIENDWSYVEGYAMSEILPVMHAWCLDNEGQVVETTWETAGTEYYGVTLEIMWVTERIAATGMWGVMPNDYLNEYQLLKAGVPLEAKATEG